MRCEWCGTPIDRFEGRRLTLAKMGTWELCSDECARRVEHVMQLPWYKQLWYAHFDPWFSDAPPEH